MMQEFLMVIILLCVMFLLCSIIVYILSRCVLSFCGRQCIVTCLCRCLAILHDLISSVLM